MNLVKSDRSLTIGNKLLFEKKYVEALAEFSAMAEEGNAEAQYMAAELHRVGLGTPQNLDNAYKYYLESSRQNNGYSFYRIGQFYLNGWVVDTDNSLALEFFNKALNDEVNLANLEIGKIYLYGLGVEKDIEKAVSALKKCLDIETIGANLESEYNKNILEIKSYAARELASAYARADNFPLLEKREILWNSRYWIRESADYGNYDAKLELITVWGPRPVGFKPEEISEYEHNLYVRILDITWDIENKLEKNDQEFSAEFNKSAQDVIAKILKQDVDGAANGEPVAEYWLGFRCWNKIGVLEDLQKSFDLILCSASKGFIWAELLLASFYLDGTGVSVNVSEAIKYAERAFNKTKNSFAAYTLGLAYESKGIHKNYQRSFEYYKEATCSGAAFWRLGDFLENGKGCEIDLILAKEFYNRASNSDVHEATLRLAIWRLLGIDEAEDLEQATLLFDKIPYALKRDFDDWKMLPFYEKRFYEKAKIENPDSNQDLPEYAFSCSSACWAICKVILKDEDIFSNNIKLLLQARGLNWFVKGLNSKGSEPKVYTQKWIAREVVLYLEMLPEIIGKNISKFDAYVLILNLHKLGYHLETAPYFLTLAKEGAPFAQCIVGEYYRTGYFFPKSYLESYAWLNLGNSTLGVELDSLYRKLSTLEQNIGYQYLIQAQGMSQAYQINCDQELRRKLNQRTSSDLEELEFKIWAQVNVSRVNTLTEAVAGTVHDALNPIKKIFKDDKESGGYYPPNNYSNKNEASSIERKSSENNIFSIVLKIFLYAPVAAVLAALIYTFGAGVFTYLLTSMSR